uniref:FHA domain-containing protein n=1 Tax=Compsopogon caeruleus TaxID=31354 RepID=A0A7S1TDC7_9RHOD|mmetsp:Transcript_18627/g.39132  ORF Transcript_18627/g.39132 Transcript_18627/m.39132 type:complete len:954 (+) Transcript_18627:66-2927(+)
MKEARNDRAPRGMALAKLMGKIYLADGSERNFEYYIKRTWLSVGRASDPKDPLFAGTEGVDLGVGDSNKLSREHAIFALDPREGRFFVTCTGKNGLTLTRAKKTMLMLPSSPPQLLEHRSLLLMGDTLIVFLLPQTDEEEDPSEVVSTTWNKAEHASLRAALMSLGFGRWKDIQTQRQRLRTKPVAELRLYARSLVAKCVAASRSQVERRGLEAILREELPESMSEEERDRIVQAELFTASQDLDQAEGRKLIRWARKIRLLARLRDIVHHPSLEKVKSGEISIFHPPPAPTWGAEDDWALLYGFYLHGYSATEKIRTDPNLGFANRFTATLNQNKRDSVISSKPAEDDEDSGADDGSGTGNQSSRHLDEDDVQENEDKGEPFLENTTRGSQEIQPDGDGRYPFPSSETLIRRIKSLIHLCAKEVDRDKRAELRTRESQRKERLREASKQDSRRTARKATKSNAINVIREPPPEVPSLTSEELCELEDLLIGYGIVYNLDRSRNWQPIVERSQHLKSKPVESLDLAFEDMLECATRTIEATSQVESPLDFSNQECSAFGRRNGSSDGFRHLRHDSNTSKELHIFTSDRAYKLLERVEFFRVLRQEVLPNEALSKILRGCKRSKELPAWWRSSLDRDLLIGVARYGLNDWDSLFKDPDLGFLAALKDSMSGEAIDKDLEPKFHQFPRPVACLRRAKTLLGFYRARVGDAPSVVGSNVPVEKKARRPPTKRALEDGEEAAGNIDTMTGGEFKRSGTGPGQFQFPDMIPRKRDGDLDLPFPVSEDLELHGIGHIVSNGKFHNQNFIFPCNYKAVRIISAGPAQGRYVCEISMSANGDPSFHVRRETFDAMVLCQSFSIGSATPAFLVCLNYRDDGEDPGPAISAAVGFERFGLCEPLIVREIQALEEAENCYGYIWKGYDTEATPWGSSASVSCSRNGLAKPPSTKKRAVDGPIVL